jgi:hypothetical protein
VAELQRALEENFALFYLFVLLWVAAWAAFFAWRRLRRGPIHPPFSDANVRFVERFASGFSNKSLFTRFGGAQNALVVKVLRDALFIEPLAIFKWLLPPGFGDLEHYVPKSRILGVRLTSGFLKKGVQIEFQANDGGNRTLELKLRNPEAFLAALKA